MFKYALKRALAGLVAVALGTGLAVSTATLAANAVDVDNSSKCIVDVIHHEAVKEVSHEEYQYEKTIPGKTETSHPEYRYSKTAKIYTVEHKQVQYLGDSSEVLSWLDFHGVEGPDGVWTLSDQIVNSAGVNPLAPGIFYDGPFSDGHKVPLSSYGGPNVSVRYTITGIEWGLTVPATPFYTSHNVTLYYTGAGNGSVDDDDAIYVAVAPGNGWNQFGAVKNVSDNNGYPAKTVYYLTGGTTSDALTAANWTLDKPSTVIVVPAPGDVAWKQIGYQKIVDTAAKDAYDENVYGDCPPPTVSCFANTVDDNLVLPATPGVLWKVNGGSAVPGPVSIPLSSSDITVEAIPAPGSKFAPGKTTWTFEADEDGLCQVPTLAQFPTNVTTTDQVCTAGKVTGGTITVGVVNGTSFFAGEVDYFLDGSLTPMTQQTVTVKAGTHTVTAVPHDPNDSLEGLTSWSVTVKAASAVCGDLTTLALTGAASPVGGALLGVLLFGAGLSVIAVHMRRRRMEVAE